MHTDNASQPRLSFLQKTILAIAGLVFCLITLELSLRIGGFIILSFQEYSNRRAIYQEGAFRVMCIGESTTLLGGKDSYPSLLETIFNQRKIGIKFSVINEGVGGVNSDYLILRLENNLNRYNPNMVIAMMGSNDQYIKYYEGIDGARSKLFKNLKTYKFFRLLWMHIMNKAFLPQHYLNIVFGLKTCYAVEPDCTDLEDKLRRAEGLGVNNADLYMELGLCIAKHRRFEEAIELFKKSLEIKPDNRMAYLFLGACYRDIRKFREAEEVFLKLLSISPMESNVYWALGRCYYEEGKLKESEEILKKASELNPKEEKIYRALSLICRDIGKDEAAKQYMRKANEVSLGYGQQTRRNYLKLKEALDKRGIKLVCVQYPMRSIEPLKSLFDNPRGIIFVDNEKIFKEAVGKTSYKDYFTDMFGGDFGHCTRKGNRLLAENIAQVIMKEYFER